MIEIQYIADKQLEKDWHKVKKCEPGKDQVRTLALLGSTYIDCMRKVFPVKWPIKVLRQSGKGNVCKIDYQKLLNMYPNFNDANQKFYTKIVNSQEKKKKKKKRKSRAEQRKIYKKLLDSGKVKNQAEIARKFGVSRAWVSKVLS